MQLVPQYLAAHKNMDSFLMWVDFTKCGRLNGKDLNHCLDLVTALLTKQPLRSVALILAPHLISEKVANGQRGERRTPGKTKTCQTLQTLPPKT